MAHSTKMGDHHKDRASHGLRIDDHANTAHGRDRPLGRSFAFPASWNGVQQAQSHMGARRLPTAPRRGGRAAVIQPPHRTTSVPRPDGRRLAGGQPLGCLHPRREDIQNWSGALAS